MVIAFLRMGALSSCYFDYCRNNPPYRGRLHERAALLSVQHVAQPPSSFAAIEVKVTVEFPPFTVLEMVVESTAMSIVIHDCYIVFVQLLYVKQQIILLMLSVFCCTTH